MPLQKNFINGNALPNRTGMPTADLNALYSYLWNAMEQLRYIIEQLEKASGGKAGKDAEALESLQKRLNGLRYAAAETAGGAASRTAAIPIGKVDASSTSTAFTATVPGIDRLYEGVCVWLTNGVVTSAAGFTVNINGLGAKPCFSSLESASQSSTVFNLKYTMLLVYNEKRVAGGCWDIVYGYDSNTNSIGYQLRTNSLTMPMADTCYRYRLLFTSQDGTKWVPANTSTSTNATAARTVNSRKIDPHGRIVYYGSTTALKVTAQEVPSPGATVLWTQYLVTLGYSFNRTGAALTMSYPAPVYVKAAPQTDGSAIIDADNPFVQALPSAADGKIYIFLGTAINETQIELVQEHPIYAYSNGAIRRWVGP